MNEDFQTWKKSTIKVRNQSVIYFDKSKLKY